jgi:hypothetical protein
LAFELGDSSGSAIGGIDQSDAINLTVSALSDKIS